MLVLSRKKDEKIIIGDGITIMVIEVRGDKVRLGIDAPKEISVHREEVYNAIQKGEDGGKPTERKKGEPTGQAGGIHIHPPSPHPI